MKTRTLPKYITNKFLIKILKGKVLTAVSYWIFQGILYMDPYEKLFKIFFDIVGTAFIGLLLSIIFGWNLWLLLIIAFVIGHTLNMLFNGHLFTLGKFLGSTRVKEDEYINYISEMKKRWIYKSCLRFLVIYGSLSRDKLSETSDLDVRVLSGEKIWDIILCCFWVFAERSRALFAQFPIDIYVESKLSGLKKMRSDEIPVILLSRDIPEKYFPKFKLFKELKTGL